MNLAFISTNREILPDPVVPLGLLYLAANVPEHHRKEVWDLCFESDPHRCLREKIDSFQPELIAVGLRNIQNSDYTDSAGNIAFCREIIQTIRQVTRAPIVLGGSGFSVIPEPLMRHLRPDFGIAGEGELAFSRLVQEVESGSLSLSNVPALYYFHNHTLSRSPSPAGFSDLDQLRHPGRRHVRREHYELTGIDSIQTKRGCPLHCTYCTYPKIEGRRKRLRHPGAVVREMQNATSEQPHINHFFIVDAVFNHPPRHAQAICDALIRENWQIPWTAYINPLGFNAKLAEQMAEAQCAGFELGSDSGTDNGLIRLRKGFQTSDIVKARDLAAAYGLKDCHTFILGTPGESLDDVRRSLDFIARLDPFTAILMVWKDDAESLDPELRARREGFRHEVLALLESACPDFPEWIIPSLKINFSPRAMRILRQNGFTGPLWQHIRKAQHTALR